MEEIWKDIKGFEGLYQISNYGRVKRVEHTVIYSNGRVRIYHETLLKAKPNIFGYYYLNLTKDKVSHSYRVHRLVAENFIPNPENLKVVNHIDEDKTNNRVDNLEWCTPAYNNSYGTRPAQLSRKLKGRVFSEETRKKMSEAKKGIMPKCSSPKSIMAYNEEHKSGIYFESASAAASYLGKKSCGNISSAANGILKQAYGYTWKYV